MDRLTIILSALLLVTSLLADVAYTENHVEPIDSSKRKMLLFGPQLGRKKRNPRNSDDSYRTLEREQIIDVIKAPWAIVTVNNEGKLQPLTFTPRLGRGSGEELVSNAGPNIGDRWLQESDLAGELMSQRSPPFAPRLGRRVLPFSPRLGRENDRS